MKMIVEREYSRNMLLVINHLASFTSVTFYLDTKSFMDNVTASIEARTEKHSSVQVDVVQIYSGTNKDQKFVNINILGGKVKVPGMHPRVLIEISVGDIGVNHPNAQLVMNLEFPEDQSTLIQKRDQATWDGKDALFVESDGVAPYLRLVQRIRDSCSYSLSDDDAVAGNIMGFNNLELLIP